MDAQDIAKLEATQPEPSYQDETDPAVREGWQIDSIGSLEWAMSRVADLETEAAENEAALAEAHRRLDARAAQLADRVKRGIGFFKAAVLRYMEAHRPELLKGGKKKSRVLLYGSVGWRASGGRLRVLDREMLAAWAAKQPVELGLFRIKIEPEMKVIQAYAKAGNLIPPGCEWESEHETAYVNAISPGTTLAKVAAEEE
jgi:phage host-nuclease inhibitor protein Gam